MNTTTLSPTRLPAALAEPFAFALLQWPPLLALLHVGGDGGWALVLRIAAGALLALALLGAYGGGRGLGFGNTMLAAAGCVAGAWWAWPSAWAVAWLAAIALLMLAAQQLRLQRLLRGADTPAVAAEPTAFDRATRGGGAMTAGQPERG